MVYRITLTSTATYELDASLYTPNKQRFLPKIGLPNANPTLNLKRLLPVNLPTIVPMIALIALCADKEEKRK